MTMTAEAKSELSKTIRGLREKVIDDLHAEVDRVYRMGVALKDAGLAEAPRRRRERFESWIEEQLRAETGAAGNRRGGVDAVEVRARARRDAEKQATYTLLNRIVILRLMEVSGLRGPAVVTNGWESKGYKAFRALAPALRGDDTEGYAYLLQLVFDDLAVDLPGLFGSAGIADVIPTPAATLRHVVEALDDAALASCWSDDMTLGWVYQYFNDPEREALDKKLNEGGKVAPHEIASKTQMFTERYMVDWLLHNSIGPMWLSLCRRQGWVAEVLEPSRSMHSDPRTSPSAEPRTSPPNPLSMNGEGEPEATSVLGVLEARRVDWRAKRDSGEVSLTALMPLHSEIERRWAYYLPQPIVDDDNAPDSVRDWKIIDPAVGSGHFLVVAFELLCALYAEEARHRGLVHDAAWQPQAVVEHILEHNLHGIDLDPRAVQIAAAALWIKAQQTAKGAAPAHLNLVASSLRLANLPDTDPALVELRKQVEADTGVPARLTDTIVHALRGADHLGSLLKVDAAVDAAIDEYERGAPRTDKPVQGGLFGDTAPQQLRMDTASARESLVDSLEAFLTKHTFTDELGLRLRGEQLATGVRFVRLLQEGQYDLVVGNPPYQGTSKMVDASYVAKHYPKGKADLYAAFLERGLQLARPGGTSSLLTMRNWMFIKQYAELRQWLLETFDLRALGDLDKGAFESMTTSQLISICMSVFRRSVPTPTLSLAIQPTGPGEKYWGSDRTDLKRAAVLVAAGRYDFEPAALRVVPEWPLVYWWSSDFVKKYAAAPKLQDSSPAKFGVNTGSNIRFLRRTWEILSPLLVALDEPISTETVSGAAWVPYLKGGGFEWMHPPVDVINWKYLGLTLKVSVEHNFGNVAWKVSNEGWYFKPGVAFAKIGATFSAREHRFRSVIDSAGSSVYPEDNAAVLCLLNSSVSRSVLASINPTVNFQVGDVNRIPNWRIESSSVIADRVRSSFGRNERANEVSPEFRAPSSTSWRYTQAWAKTAVDRPERAPVPAYVEVLDPEPDTDHVSFALGVALGRFHYDGRGIRDPDNVGLETALMAGICFLDGTLESLSLDDDLGHPHTIFLRQVWEERGARIAPDTDLRTWLRLKFFPDVHKGMYENRPIHWPLSSKNKTFVAFANIHRMNADTLRVLLAEHLEPTKKRIDGEIADLIVAKDSADKKTAKEAEKRYAQVFKWREELLQFIADVTACAERGPPPTDAACRVRDRDARYDPDLDDGVMINSAALWPLLEPQWKDPKKWWKELSNASGKKDYDWSHLAMRYWPARVDGKCQVDPSLGVAHGCFWRYHPARAWAWELRLQDEIGADFRIEEKPYRGGTVVDASVDDSGDAAHRARFLAAEPTLALAAIEKEVLRRLRKQKKPQPSLTLLEPGLWSAVPAECWALELRLTTHAKQQLDFMLHAPDEAEARAAFVAAHPDDVAHRARMVAMLRPPELELEGDDEEAGEDDASDDVEDAE